MSIDVDRLAQALEKWWPRTLPIPGARIADYGEAAAAIAREYDRLASESRGWREVARDLHATGDDEPYADDQPEGAKA